MSAAYKKNDGHATDWLIYRAQLAADNYDSHTCGLCQSVCECTVL